MSVESRALERSKLEQKDRTELAAIVDAMGGKAGTRAKKADLVDQILDLAGVAPSNGRPRAGGNGDAPNRGPNDAAGRADDTARSRPEPEVTVPAGAEGAAEEPPAQWELEARTAAEPEGDTDAAAVADDDRAPARQQNREGDDTRRGDAQQGGQQGARQGATPQGGNQPGQGAGQQVGQGEDGEPGNRRRRRRGRDRNRERDGQGQGQGGQGQGQGGQGAPGQDKQGGGAPEDFQGEPIDVEGYLDLRDEGYGFLRVNGFLPSKDDVYVSVKQVRQFALRKGDFLNGASRPAGRNEKNPALLRIDLVNGADPEQAKHRRRFEDLTPLFPDEKLKLEMADDPTNMTARIMDLIAPVGKGQRGLIVSPPKAGKTTIMKQIARSIEINNPEVHLIVLLVDERPEEVTDMKRWLLSGEVAASTFDRPSEEHTLVAELTIERAKRMVEDGKDVAIILDGITRLARAYNLAAPASGRIMSGGIDAGALYPPKKFFGAARNIEEGGSLTILATALVETGSRMDEHIFEEFKGTGNMELRLDRKLSERRIYPAIDVDASSTRHEELLFPRAQLNLVWKLRRVLSALASDSGSGGAGLELLIDRMKTFKTNDEFLSEIAKAPMGG